MCEKSYLCMWQRARRYMSQDDFTYVLYSRVIRVFMSRANKNRPWAQSGMNTHKQQPVNDCEARIFWVTSEKNCSTILCAYSCMWPDISSLRTLSFPSSLRRSPTLSMPVCTDLSPSARPAGRTGASSVQSLCPAHSCRFAHVTRSRTPIHPMECVCVCLCVCLLHVWSFSSLWKMILDLLIRQQFS